MAGSLIEASGGKAPVSFFLIVVGLLFADCIFLKQRRTDPTSFSYISVHLYAPFYIPLPQLTHVMLVRRPLSFFCKYKPSVLRSR